MARKKIPQTKKQTHHMYAMQIRATHNVMDRYATNRRMRDIGMPRIFK